MPVDSSRKPKRSKGDSTKNRARAVKPKTVSLKTARIHSAVVKGKQILLPSETGGLNLSKFEHNGREGRLAVYAEETSHLHNVVGHYKIIATFQPVNSVQNELFFGKTSHNWKASGIRQSPRSDDRTRFSGATPPGKTKNRRQTKPDTFEELILKYKAQREKIQTGKQHLEVLEILDSIYKRKKEEWTRIEREFSCLEKVRKELGQLGKSETEMDLRRKTESGNSGLKLPAIKVSSVHGKGKRNVSKQDSKSLKIPKERVGSLQTWTTGII